MVCERSAMISPVSTSNSLILSTSSPKNSILMPLAVSDAGTTSSMSPLTLKVPLEKSMSFLSYWISISFLTISSLSRFIPGLSDIDRSLYSSGFPRPYMQDTDATIMTSLLSKSADVAECLSLSISSFIDESFSMNVSVCGTYASGW